MIDRALTTTSNFVSDGKAFNMLAGGQRNSLLSLHFLSEITLQLKKQVTVQAFEGGHMEVVISKHVG